MPKTPTQQFLEIDQIKEEATIKAESDSNLKKLRSHIELGV